MIICECGGKIISEKKYWINIRCPKCKKIIMKINRNGFFRRITGVTIMPDSSPTIIGVPSIVHKKGLLAFIRRKLLFRKTK